MNIFKKIEKDIKISNKANGKELKLKFLHSMNYNPDNYKIRLLINGQEIKDEDYLHDFKVLHKSVIQVSILEIDEKSNQNKEEPKELVKEFSNNVENLNPNHLDETNKEIVD